MDHTDVGLRAAIRALTDVVAPAVDAGHAQARDQLRLVEDYLGFVLERYELIHERHRFELRHHLEMAQAVHAALGDAANAQLVAAIDQGREANRAVGASASTMTAAGAELAAQVAQAVREAMALPVETRRAVELCVLHASHQRIAFERAWYLPLRLDPDPQDVRPLDELLRPA
ncbi:hypothetical protein BH09PSE5_BH09PSE5_08770 [soil metagenome]